MAKIKKSRREVAAPVAVTANRLPLVSVIIPMYNSAKFIPQTLESLLYQTITDFEVVVVDDCSTDNSVAVVESFAERFGGRLHVIKLRENTGTPGLPRNVGIQCARGKYIAFLDSDDLFTKTALEEFTTLAEKFQAEVVKLHRNFILWNGQKKSVDDPAFTDMNELINPKNFRLEAFRKNILPEPKLEPDDIAERVRKWISTPPNSFWATCLQFYRRDFLIANQIFFPPMLTCEDASFAFEALCLAKRYLNAPNVTYIVRPRLGSVSRDTDVVTYEYRMHKRICTINDGFNELEKIMSEINFFAKHPDYRYAVLEWFANVRLQFLYSHYAQIPAFKLNDLIKREFHPDDAALAAYLFNTVNVQRLQLMKLQQELKTLKASK